MRNLAFALVLITAAGAANADTWSEVQDAGGALSPQRTGLLSGITLDAITGMGGLDAQGNNTDVDSYVVHIGGDWGATTVSNGTGWDTMLFLSSMDGSTLLAFNDDSSSTVQSTISGALADGNYVLSIARYNNQYGTVPINDLGGGTQSYTITCRGMTTVAPTPGSLALLGIGGLAAARRRRAR